MTRDRGDEGFTPRKLRDDLDTLAGLSDALDIVSQAAESKDADCERTMRAVGALAREISHRIDTLYGEMHDALNDPASFLGGKRGGRR